ncbi:MAG: 2-oxo acid dehydrogenase subunit E2 [Acidobacteria bacterium]|nr:2-oxo acid dehydrogenase subunit E2 [Acidobacteriota bacterium]
MNTKVIMPQLGESVYEGTLTKWLKKTGDPVVKDEPLFEVSTDKVDSEIPAPASGILDEILVDEGTTIKIDTVVAVIRESAGDGDAGGEEPGEETAREPAAETGTEAGGEAGKTGEEGAEAAGGKAKEDSAAPSIRPQSLLASPLVRKIARENGVDLADVAGTGLEGRITKDDLEKHLSRVGAARPAAPAAAGGAGGAAAAPESGPGGSAGDDAETVPMTPMRRAIAERMVESKRTSAHVNTMFEIDMSAIVRLRQARKEDFLKREGIPLTYTPFFAKALVESVRNFPVFNSSVSGDAIVYKKGIHLGIAVALEAGLIVPVVRAAHLKNFTGIALAIHDLAERARTKRLKPEEVQNGTITLTNPGIYGSLFGTPVINQPQVAILGIGAITKRPVVIDDAIAIRSMAYLSLSFDHRVIDGAVADQFMADLKARLEAWTEWQD